VELRDELGDLLGYRRAATGTWSGRCVECGGHGAMIATTGYTCHACGRAITLDALRAYVAIGDAARNGERPADAVGTVMAEVEPVEVSWLWPGRIPLGRLTILDGDPGLGKSSVTLDLTARVTRGRAMPDGSIGLGAPAGVVLLGAEDGLADTVRPRLDAAGADCTRVYALTGVRDGHGRPRLPTVADVHAIRQAADAVGAVLLIVDPLSAYMGRGVDGHRDIDVRTALAELAALAEASGLAVLLIRHLAKSGGQNPLYRGGGSIAIIAAARSGLLLARDPDDADRLVLATTKGNLAPPQLSLGLRLVTTAGALRVDWTGVSARSAADLLATVDGAERSARDDAEDWLREALAAGPRASRDVQRDARADGVTERTLRRARESLGVIVERRGAVGSGQRWIWHLGEMTTPPGHLASGHLATPRIDTGDSGAATPRGGQGPSLDISGARLRRLCAGCGTAVGDDDELCAVCRPAGGDLFPNPGSHLPSAPARVEYVDPGDGA
jgi:hypothetical protein